MDFPLKPTLLMESPEDVALSSDGSINALLREKLKVVIFKSSCISQLKRDILQFFDFKIRSFKSSKSGNYSILHYHLQVEPNPKKIVQ